jgi:predicted negative regulator of RcsB-dependent stress response
MTSSNLASRQQGLDETISDWLTHNWRTVAIAAAVVVAAGGGIWLFDRSKAIKEENAEKAFFAAQQSAGSGNLDLARADLEKMVTRYSGTNAGTMGALLLAQIQYEQGKPADGVKTLTAAQSGAPSVMKASIEGLIGAGLSQQGKEADAMGHYQKAADLSVGNDKDGYLAEVARSAAAAGKPDEAKKIWTDIANRPDSPRAVEARVRLGELIAKPQSK